LAQQIWKGFYEVMPPLATNSTGLLLLVEEVMTHAIDAASKQSRIAQNAQMVDCWRWKIEGQLLDSF
jgi:hypothetical protein